jgi:hypothetical protein
MILMFGTFKGHELSDMSVPDSYIRWLALRGSYQMPGNRFETKWKVPIDVSIHARREMERRGYHREGDRYIKEDDR